MHKDVSKYWHALSWVKMEEIIKRVVKRLFPEITENLHLPQWGRVATVPAAIEGAKTSTASKPLYAVDIELLKGNGSKDEDPPLLKSAPLPAGGDKDVLIQQSETVFQRAVSQGIGLRECPEEISDTAKNYTEQIQEIKRSLAGLNHHIEVAGGGRCGLVTKTIMR